MLRKTFPLFAVALLSLCLVTACTVANPYTGEQHASATTKGSAIGGGAGAALGALLGRSNRLAGALIGAGVGALTGAGVGYYMDRQTKQLRSELHGSGVQVTRQGDNITLIMPGNVTFALNKATLKPQFYDVLDSVTKVVKHYPKTVLIAAGYTDSTGSAAYNELLSKQRAQAVADHIENKGVNPRRVLVHGFGESHPIASNQTDSGRQQNRRVELSLKPLTKQGT